MELNKFYNENCLTGLKRLPDNSIDCCVTSPPYFGLRDYGTSEQIGLEDTPELFIDALVQVFSEVRRVLKPEGTLWLNLGDSYAGGGGASGHTAETKNMGATTSVYGSVKSGGKRYGLKQKDLIGVPWMAAFALRSAGWYLRQDIIWHKPNPMPESVTDRCTKSHEYIFLLSKSAKYYYDHDAIKTVIAESSFSRLSQDVENQTGSDRVPNKSNGKMKAVGQYVGGKKHKNMEDKGQELHSFHKTRNANGQEWQSEDGKANKRSVWTVTTKPYSEAHFATFPEDLIVDMIKAGCPERKFTCNCCGFDVNLHESNTIVNETVYKELQAMWSKVQRSRSVEQRENILHEEMLISLHSKEQGVNEGVDDFNKRIQDGCRSKSSKQNKVRLHDGASVSDGEKIGKIPFEDRGCSSQGSQQTKQQNIKPRTINETSSRQDAQASDKNDNLSSLWEENKSIGPCPKCPKGDLIGRRGVILDCFMGAGTTAVVAKKLNRNYIGFELNSEYIKIANKRLYKEIGMFI